MRLLLSSVCVLGVLVKICFSLPLDQPSAVQQILPQQDNFEQLYEGERIYEDVVRDKRTISVLRSLFPGLAQIIDNKIQMITRFLFRVVGRLVLRGGILGGGGGGGGGGTATSSSSAASSANNGRRISITLPTYPPSADDEDEEDNTEDANTTAASEVNPEENQLSGAESQQNEVRVRYSDDDDQQLQATGYNEAPETAASENEEVNDALEDSEDPRNKRYLNFGFGGGTGASSSSSGGSGGGSGNFLFDIIRLVAGSGTNSEASDDKGNLAVAGGGEGSVEKDGAGVPGPITRLFIIANRGIANLVQDLILRLAQTSERIVNFKARLITSII